eukprot:CAMPEP_0114255720 /NCGR_PEP_ID=MMETSP0058-20121206/17722_1 /TAXON_ID=36894 /ORGANISM="Pyramimonas parkeae, CCMP726" /LENGTH=528 /DNA_ID=CAMNT_0001370143 /DNA_START=90 /DNA_END=1676 /DNA_ORIENTATION=+
MQFNLPRISRAHRSSPSAKIFAHEKQLRTWSGDKLCRSIFPVVRTRPGRHNLRVNAGILDDIADGNLGRVARQLKIDPKLVEQRGNNGQTPLMVAAVRGDTAMVQLLLKQGAKVWLPDKADWTALHYAVLKDQVQVVQLLLANGADPRNITRGKDGEGFHSALNLAQSDACRKLLEDVIAGKKIPMPTLDEGPGTSLGDADNATSGTKPKGSSKGEDSVADPNTNTEEQTALLDVELMAVIKALRVDPQQVKIAWDDIAGLAEVKREIELNLLGAMQRPELFTGLLQPSRGILFYGPPGTGKTMLAKAIAKRCNASFYSLSASSLGSKYVGESEKLVKLLFDDAQRNQPAIIFFDEIDSVLRARMSGEEEWVRKVKNEFLVRLQEIQEGGSVYFIAATNTPKDLDEAVLRRLERKFYIPLPDADARFALLTRLGKMNASEVTEEEWWQITTATEGYSAADLKSVCTQAARTPLKEAFEKAGAFDKLTLDNLRTLKQEDYIQAIQVVRPSVSAATVQAMKSWGEATSTE